MILSLGLLHCKSVNDSELHILKIDSSIKQKAIKIISYKKGLNIQRNWFNSNLYAEHFTNDKIDEIQIDTIEAPFLGKYYWKHDTLSLSVSYGDLGAFGFDIDIAKDTTGILYFEECSHIHPKFKYKLTDTLSVCAKVPCTYSKLLISKFPYKTEDDVIFGYVNFKTDNFYYEDNEGALKIRKVMKFYFRASFDFYRSKYYKSD